MGMRTDFGTSAEAAFPSVLLNLCPLLWGCGERCASRSGVGR